MDGPDIETSLIQGNEIKFYWLIPITVKEKEFKTKYGIEELEKEFDKIELDYLKTNRKSVV